MAQIFPFRGLTYDPGKIADLRRRLFDAGRRQRAMG